jgi:hypothetical protein
MSYQITVPAMGEYPEETFTVEINQKPKALKEVMESLYPPPPEGEKVPKETKENWAFIRKHAKCIKIKPPKKSEWWTCELCPEGQNQVLRSDLVDHVRNFHGVKQEIEA